MAMGNHERCIRRRIERAAPAWRTTTSPAERDDELWSRRQSSFRPPPSEIALAVLLARMLDRHSDLAGKIGRVPVILMIKVPDEKAAEVLKPVAAPVLHGTFPRRETRDECKAAGAWKITVLAERDSPDRFDRAHAAERATTAIADGATLLAFWHRDEGGLPPEIVKIRTAAMVLPEVDAGLLCWLGRLASREKCHLSITDEEAADLTMDEIVTAFAFGLPASECARRVSAFTDSRRHSAAPSTLSLADLHGLGAAKVWGEHLADDLAAYRNGKLTWAEVDRGVLLSGPPGVGKTTYARALATTCNADLVPTSVAGWYAASHLGDTLKQMRGDFARAARKKPAILFIDEIDGIGDRASMSPRYRDYCTHIVNALLECLDGIERREGVVVIGACNHPERVDAALKRPGRLDREIRIPKPDSAALEQIYRHYLGSDLGAVDLQPLAAVSVGATGADVELWVRSARRIARRAGREVMLDDLVAQVRGPVFRMPEGVLRQTCIHEAGHAVAAIVLGLSEHVTVTIGTRGAGLGVTFFEQSSIPLDTRAAALDMARYTLAGRAAEEVMLGTVSGGSGGGIMSDLAQATSLVASLEGSFGLSAAGDLTWLGTPPETAHFLRHPHIARIVRSTLRDLYAEVLTLIAERRDAVCRLADALQVRFHLSGAEIVALLGETAAGTGVRGQEKPVRNPSGAQSSASSNAST